MTNENNCDEISDNDSILCNKIYDRIDANEENNNIIESYTDKCLKLLKNVRQPEDESTNASTCSIIRADNVSRSSSLDLSVIGRSSSSSDDSFYGQLNTSSRDLLSFACTNASRP